MPNFPPNTFPGQVTMFRTAPLPLPQTTTKVLFQFQNSIGPGTGSYGAGGYAAVEIVDIFGIVTTAIGAVANATKLQGLMDALAAVDLCATLDLNGATVGTILNITGTLANAMTSNANGVAIGQVTPIHMTGGLQSGSINLNCAGSDGGLGRIAWVLLARPAYGVQVISASS
jgi:hypothetical protein